MYLVSMGMRFAGGRKENAGAGDARHGSAHKEQVQLCNYETRERMGG